MDAQQALLLGRALVAAAEAAIAAGQSTVDLTVVGQGIDDQARAELQAAIERAERRK